MHWIKISCILCMFGCFKDFHPSESFITDYLTGPWKNFTADEVNHYIYSVATYSYLLSLVLMFLITDFVRYKPIIILCGLSGFATFLLIILGKIVIVLQIAKFLFGLFLSAEVAYYTYIYAKVDKKHYQEVTSHTKAASLFGRSMSGIIAQSTASFDLLNYHQLNYLTLSGLHYHVIKWSAWWALSTCGYLLITMYSQLLWQTAVKPDDRIYNGAVDFLYTIISSISVFSVGKIRLNWVALGDITCSAFAFLEAAILLASSYSYNIWFLYAGYIIFGVIYHTMVTVASFEVAKCISEDSHGLIFGVNIFLALLMQSFLTLIVVTTLKLDIRTQFYIYGGYFLVLGVIYTVLSTINIVQHRRSTTEEERIRRTV
ncbi:hypothetical protein DMN91_000010 [Ooceraea biroi]|uniref:Folate transporter n=1 Tax=Ooceraea biroi TaxID=2015173 RepID=A0A026VZZ8_OOCBI|nr:Folate transporter [Ooceraea biroi]RLU26217.1 hypothetical protein DMN91_000010 [Ooceraea biroi]